MLMSHEDIRPMFIYVAWRCPADCGLTESWRSSLTGELGAE